jgi:hypothetical protein
MCYPLSGAGRFSEIARKEGVFISPVVIEMIKEI